MVMMLPEGSGTTAYTRPKTRVYRVWNYITVIYWPRPIPDMPKLEYVT